MTLPGQLTDEYIVHNVNVKRNVHDVNVGVYEGNERIGDRPATAAEGNIF
jgi:hypothetical protein